MSKIKGYILYKIYYEHGIMYLGRTKQPLQDRIRGHLFKKPMHRSIDINLVSKVEYAEFESEADMNLYEIYYINLYKPPLNVDDKCKDKLTVALPEVLWQEFDCHLWNNWKDEINNKTSEHKKMHDRYFGIDEDISVLRKQWRDGQISEEECYEKRESLVKEKEELHKKIWQ